MTLNQKTRPTKKLLTATTTSLFLMTASPAHAETLTMICGGYSVAFSPGKLTSHAPKKDRDYPITKVDRQNGRTVVSGKTQYGKITAFFSKDGHSSIVWTNGKDVVLNQCASETELATQPPLQERRWKPEKRADSEDDEPMLRNRSPMPKAPKQEEKTAITSRAGILSPEEVAREAYWDKLFPTLSVDVVNVTVDSSPEDVLQILDIE